MKNVEERIKNVDPADTKAVKALNEEKEGLQALIDYHLQQLSKYL